MTYKLPLFSQIYSHQPNTLAPYFSKMRGNIVPGAHRLQILLGEWLCQGVLEFPAILISGSNGKGSTSAFIESILRAHGCKTGLYTSPHLIHPNERIRVNGKPVAENTLLQKIELVTQKSEMLLPDATFFELITAAAFLIFLDQKIEFLICEIGLGGHFDSTNALTPYLSVLTNITLEHTDILGKDLCTIAYDKSYISRRNKPFIVGHLNSDACKGVQETTNRTGAELIYSSNENTLICENILNEISGMLKTRDASQFIKQNLIHIRVSLYSIYHLQKYLEKFHQYEKKIKPIKLIHEKAVQGIMTTFWPGRFDVRTISKRTIIFDAAHNSNGFQYFLNQYFSSSFASQRCVIVFAVFSDKDWPHILSQLPAIASHVYFTEIHSPRCEKATALGNEFDKHLLQNNLQEQCKFEVIPKLETALEKAMNTTQEIPLLIIGSIAFIGEAMERFGFKVFGEKNI